MPQTAKDLLFRPFDLGGRELRNRIIATPMTRGRARNPGPVPTVLNY